MDISSCRWRRLSRRSSCGSFFQCHWIFSHASTNLLRVSLTQLDVEQVVHANDSPLNVDHDSDLSSFQHREILLLLYLFGQLIFLELGVQGLHEVFSQSKYSKNHLVAAENKSDICKLLHCPNLVDLCQPVIGLLRVS